MSHSETPCIAILSKQKFLFSKTENRIIKQVLSWSWHWWEEEDIRKGYRRVNVVKWKNETYWNYFRNGGVGDKGE
jgi:sensor histidine kinase YesM